VNLGSLEEEDASFKLVKGSRGGEGRNEMRRKERTNEMMREKIDNLQP
jgi:hypothetical protein